MSRSMKLSRFAYSKWYFQFGVDIMTYDNNSDIALYRFVQYVSTYNRYMVNLMVDFGRSAIIYENMNAA